MGKPDVYWVTMSQLLAWMRDPVSASELRRSGGAMCARPAPPAMAPAAPRSGANVTLSLAGAPRQVEDQRARLEAAVAGLLGAGVSDGPFVAEVKAAPAPQPAAAGAAAGSSAEAGTTTGGSVGGMSMQGSGSTSSWLQFEGPSHAGASAAGSGAVGARSMDSESTAHVTVSCGSIRQ